MSEKHEEINAATSGKTSRGKISFPLAFDHDGVERWTRSMSVFADEITHFVQARLQSDMATWAEFAACRSPNEALECQQRFAEKAWADYLGEIDKLSRLTMDAATEASSPRRRQGGRISSAKPAEAD